MTEFDTLRAHELRAGDVALDGDDVTSTVLGTVQFSEDGEPRVAVVTRGPRGALSVRDHGPDDVVGEVRGAQWQGELDARAQAEAEARAAELEERLAEREAAEAAAAEAAAADAADEPGDDGE